MLYRMGVPVYLVERRQGYLPDVTGSVDCHIFSLRPGQKLKALDLATRDENSLLRKVHI
jgi:hypothetical protein